MYFLSLLFQKVSFLFFKAIILLRCMKDCEGAVEGPLLERVRNTVESQNGIKGESISTKAVR